MARAAFRISGISQFSRRLQEFDRMAKKAGVDAQMDEADAIVRDAQGRVPVATGRLRDSGHVEGPRVVSRTVEVDAVFGGEEAPHGIVVHEGRVTGPFGPGNTPVISTAGVMRFEQWLDARGIPEDQLWAVITGLYRKGMIANKFLESAFLERRSRVPNGIAQQIANQWRFLSSP